MKQFRAPFHLDVDFYDAKGELLEWADHWGDCPAATELRFTVVDIEDRTLSTHNTREKAERAVLAANAMYGQEVR